MRDRAEIADGQWAEYVRRAAEMQKQWDREKREAA